jgi:hypothetical protein
LVFGRFFFPLSLVVVVRFMVATLLVVVHELSDLDRSVSAGTSQSRLYVQVDPTTFVNTSRLTGTNSSRELQSGSERCSCVHECSAHEP